MVTPSMRKQGSCLETGIMQGTMPGARRRRRPRTAWMDNIKTWTGLSVEESIDVASSLRRSLERSCGQPSSPAASSVPFHRSTCELSASYEPFLRSASYLTTIAEKHTKMHAIAISTSLNAARLGVRRADWSVTLRSDWCISIRI